MGWPIYSARVLVRTQPEARHANTHKPSRQPVSRGREKNRSSRFKKRKSRRRRCCCCDAIVLPVVARQPICQLFHANVPVRDATHCQPLPSSSSSISGSSPPIPCSGSRMFGFTDRCPRSQYLLMEDVQVDPVDRSSV